MEDEVFVRVSYERGDFVAARQLGLLERLKETSAFQFAGFVFVAGAGVYFFAPDPFGRIFASLAGALVLFVGLIVGLGWYRATFAKVTMPKSTNLAFEFSNDGVVLKGDEHYLRTRWKDFDRAAFGRGIFLLIGRASIVIPLRNLRADQIETLRTLAIAHEDELGSGSAAASSSAK